MTYLTFNEYSKYSGKVSESAFAALERKSKKKLDYFTQNRLVNATVITDQVKECMVEFIDHMSDMESGDKVSSFSNDGVSVTFEKQQKSDDEMLYDIAVEYLPCNLICLAVNL